MRADEVRFLYAYNRWANARALAATSALAPAQLHADRGTSYRSVFGTLAHILWWEWRWLGRWVAPRPPPGPDPVVCLDLPALQARWVELERVQADFLGGLTDASLWQGVTYENPPGTAWTYPLGQLLQHVVNHSTYHRGQITTLLRQLRAGVVATDFLVFIDERDAAAADSVGGGA